MKLSRLFQRKPRPVVVFVSGEPEELLPGDNLDVRALDGSKVVLERSIQDGPKRTPVLRLVAYARPNGLRAVKPKMGSEIG